MASKEKCNWNKYPYPYAIIDNFLPEEEFEKLLFELDKADNEVQRSFRTPLERKTIYKDTRMKREAKKLVSIMASNEIKDRISEQIGKFNILSMGETEGYSSYSPFHITNNNGYLGSHIDHSYIKNGSFRHIANTIFYASNTWENDWGGNTILFSQNGLIQKVIVDPVPNRLIIFIHTANSFHGVKKYFSPNNVLRRTFYHDYYVQEKDIKNVMDNININRKYKLNHCIHDTTFIPFFPFGLNKVKLYDLINPGNLRYLHQYLIYLLNFYLKTNIFSVRGLIRKLKLKIKNILFI